MALRDSFLEEVDIEEEGVIYNDSDSPPESGGGGEDSLGIEDVDYDGLYDDL